MDFSSIYQLLDDAIAQSVCSAASLVVVYKGQPVYSQTFGSEHGGEDALSCDDSSLFDLASLTKPLVVATLTARFLHQDRLSLNEPVSRYLGDWSHGKKARVQLRHLLEHSSGLPAWKPYFEQLALGDNPRATLIHAVSAEELQSEPGVKSVYSDLDYMLLGTILEQVGGDRLDHLFQQHICDILGITDLFFLPLDEKETDTRLQGRTIVATEICPRRGLLQGQVHDDNAFVVGGVCGHAGLFGTAQAVMKLLQQWQAALDGKGHLFDRRCAHAFVYPQASPPPQSSYIPGWDRPVWKTSQAGRHISPHSIGHLGFTGVSAWLDHERQVAVVLLTNRVHPSRDDERHIPLRREIHTRIFEILGETAPGPFCAFTDPNAVKNVHLVGVAGTGMGSLAGMLKSAGYNVTGSDQAIYPPMSILLEKQKIPVKQPFASANLQPPPDLAIVGNVCTRDHVEVVEIKRKDIPHDSFAGTLERFFLAGKKSLVVAGTHGKTTTSSLMAHLLDQCELDPSFMIGGLVQNFHANYKLGSGDYFVIEGDEYDSAYFDKYPKFLHYCPFGAIVTSIEFDHADIFDSVEKIQQHFESFVKLIPSDGVLAVCWDYERVREVAKKANCKVLRYGQHPEADVRAENVCETEDGISFSLVAPGIQPQAMELPMSGRHNLDNTLGVLALLLSQGLSPQALANGLPSFLGVARRQQVRGIENGVRVIDDFAHHPTAIAVTLAGLRQRYPKGRLLVAFDPRTNTTSRNIFQKELSECFSSADLVWIGKPSRSDRIAPEDRLDPEKLAKDICSRGKEAHHVAESEQIAVEMATAAQDQDTIAVLSNGSFGGLHEKLLEQLRRKA